MSTPSRIGSKKHWILNYTISWLAVNLMVPLTLCVLYLYPLLSYPRVIVCSKSYVCYFCVYK